MQHKAEEITTPCLHRSEVHNLAAASQLVPILQQWVSPKSVLDVGCGLGDFLEIFRQAGVTDLLGIDGAWVNSGQLLMPAQYFRAADLERFAFLGRQFDLVLCLEVAEHLSPEVGPAFIATLVRHGHLVVFSAAIPGQGGQHHLNERPHAYWAGLFAEHGYACYDVIRPMIWGNENIPWWYRQNILLFARQGYEPASLKNRQPVAPEALLTMVHTALLQACRNEIVALQEERDRYRQLHQGLLDGRYTWASYRSMISNKLHHWFRRD